MEKPINKSRIWKKLARHHRWFKDTQMKDLFASDAKRAEKYSIALGSLFVDYSKNRFNEKTMRYLLDLAKEVNLKEHIET